MGLFIIITFFVPPYSRRDAETALAADAKFLNELLVSSLIAALEVIKKLTATGNHADKAVTGGDILLVTLEVGGESFNLLGKKGNLNLAGTCVTLVTLEGLANCNFINLAHK
jgi:hypothetical protein